MSDMSDTSDSVPIAIEKTLGVPCHNNKVLSSSQKALSFESRRKEIVVKITKMTQNEKKVQAQQQ
jgi:hypothetical protein